MSDDFDFDGAPPDEPVYPKTDFRDTRMNHVACPLCGAATRTVRIEDSGFGEFGMYQCPECGMYMDICNMVDKPTEFDVVTKVIGGSWSLTLRSSLKEAGYFPRLPYEASKNYVKGAKEEAKLDKLEAQIRCTSCNEKFNPAPSAKSLLTLEYCPPCRRKPEVREEVAKREAEAKAKAKKNKRKTTRKKKG